MIRCGCQDLCPAKIQPRGILVQHNPGTCYYRMQYQTFRETFGIASKTIPRIITKMGIFTITLIIFIYKIPSFTSSTIYRPFSLIVCPTCQQLSSIIGSSTCCIFFLCGIIDGVIVPTLCDVPNYAGVRVYGFTGGCEVTIIIRTQTITYYFILHVTSIMLYDVVAFLQVSLHGNFTCSFIVIPIHVDACRNGCRTGCHSRDGARCAST